ncbi:YifB family Mg chelatase-like AAA ATPase [Acanthopleuribacter pedis]|uniref:YifB family Mg chelatase-like AAA ATPase n=1 Tax=Acanthopleuribacter pedis TaxID=442870 RepID=A0A8J7Q8D3_9BACT|nr:YifB family Mg chelatase-like AAA ATPase [Acanthopleuribacter pedis]MBO1319587.1 YifB family Mg chelatase-like AAA ATPase [Acanthopleuribacter pedis]
MISHVASAAPHGVQAVPICVEVDVRKGALKVSIVGLPDAATRESKDRLIPAINNSGFALHNNEIVINLSPADLRKEGTAYDLPMAVGILVAMGVIPSDAVACCWFVGELALDGRLRPLRSVLSVGECARQRGGRRLFVPIGNGPEAALIRELDVLEVEDLPSLVRFLRGRDTIKPSVAAAPAPNQQSACLDLADVKGQTLAKRALEIAAAGAHNLLFYGPPGSGKSMLSKRVPSILPPMSETEMLEVTRIHGSSKEEGFQGALLRRPFRAPHHTASPPAVIGGGPKAKAGEVTLAHRGVLFLDELPEFPRPVLETLRQPLEDGIVTISRAAHRMTYPADFMLVAAMNACPCGWKGDPRRRCVCTPDKVKTYRHRLSGPLMDRIDLQIEVQSLPIREIRRLPPSESSKVIRKRVVAARRRQMKRFGCATTTNGNMSPAELCRFCRVPVAVAEMLEQRLEALGFTTRGYAKVLRVARTIADLGGFDDIQHEHLLEAIAYRRFDCEQDVFSLQGSSPAVG